ncbi:MAG: PIN domain-containing protein, partial [Gemmatimonas sp.]
VTHPRVLRQPWSGSAAREFLRALQASPGLSMLLPTDRHSAVIDEVMAEIPGIAGNLWHDAETAVLMREHGIRRICTRDTDFHRFPFLEPVDPISGGTL